MVSGNRENDIEVAALYNRLLPHTRAAAEHAKSGAAPEAVARLFNKIGF